MAGLDPLQEAAAVAPLIGHVQYADAPGRGAPGTGRVDLRAFVERLADLGYAGHIGLEFTPAGPTAAALAFLRDAPAGAPFPG
jgi:hydroxypyruvate isomerase